jgi:PadR family transcriptional regulator PadR
MGKGQNLGEFEQLVLLALIRLGPSAYGVTVRRELQQTARREVTLGTVYGTLERLEEKGLIASRRADPDPSRGGRPRRYFSPNPAGEEALGQAAEMMSRMWEGVGAEFNPFQRR